MTIVLSTSICDTQLITYMPAYSSICHTYPVVGAVNLHNCTLPLIRPCREGAPVGPGTDAQWPLQVYQEQLPSSWWVGLLLRLSLATGCAVLVAGLYVVRSRVTSQRLQVLPCF